MSSGLILIVDDEKNILGQLSRLFDLEGYRVECAGNARVALEKAAKHPVDLILLDVQLPDMNGLDVLSTLRRQGVEAPTIVMSGHGNIETAVKATKLGAYDFIEKPISSEKILVTVENALKLQRLTEETNTLRQEEGARYRIVGESPAIKELLQHIEAVAPSRGRVLITGENGTGKELVARAIHACSSRATGPFVALNCAAVPAELMESELFGHEKGAFTGASARRRGRFERAHGGTLFLDEVAELRSDLQAKLLRVLQEEEFERVGGVDLIRVDSRVIAATNRNLEQEVAEDRFRADLFYRLNVVPVHVPALRDRPDDIAVLARAFMSTLCAENGKATKTFTDAAVDALTSYPFPGNVRELRNLVERLVILLRGESVDESDVRRLLDPMGVGVTPARSTAAIVASGPLKDRMNAYERQVIRDALEGAGWNVTAAASELGLERSHLYKKMRGHGIERGEDRA